MSEPQLMSIHFGAMAEPLTKQLDGLLPAADLKRYDAMANAITMCAVHNLISDGEVRKARQRLMKKMAQRQKELLQPKRKT